ncbi:MAG: hypothetical protein QOF48_3652 [Verrucomicrobiota bacterium]|jgi:ABC-type transport system involved in multi-copper enzyme maturation permease subunit
MNPRTAKDIRVLRPALSLLLVAALLPMVSGPHWHEASEIWIVGLFFTGCLIMGAEIFGNEFQHNTVLLLLSQPISRARIWREKMRTLAVALALGTACVLATVLCFDRRVVLAEDFPWLGFALIPIGAFCSVPYWTLVFQSSLMGGLVTVVTPTVILGFNSALHERWLQNPDSLVGGWFKLTHQLHQLWVQDPAGEESSVLTILVVYCAVCCWLGYRKFTLLEVANAHSSAAGRELGLPVRLENVVLRPMRLLGSKFTGVFAVLMKKELRLQQVAFVGATIFCMLVTTLALLFATSSANGSGQGWIPVFIMGSFAIYLPVLPLVVGSVAVAEEKAWGVADWQFTLPPSTGTQWRAKVLTAMGTSLILGVLVPLALAATGGMLFGKSNPEALPFLHEMRDGLTPHGFPLAPVSTVVALICCLLAGQALLTSIAIYAGTLVTNTSRALMLSLGIILVSAGIIAGICTRVEVWMLPRQTAESDARTVSLAVGGGVLLLSTCMLHILAFWNYRTRERSRKVLAIQLLLLVLAAVQGAAAILFVAWAFRGPA